MLRQFHSGYSLNGAQHGSASGHVAFHLVHIFCLFQAYSSGIKGEPFSDKYNRILVFSARIVFEYDKFRWLDTAL